MQKSGGHWPKDQTVRVYRSTKPNTYDDRLRAQARFEEWLGDAPDFRERVRDFMEMLCARPRENEYSGHERRVV